MKSSGSKHDDLLKQYAVAKTAAQQAADRVKAIEAELVAYMESKQKKTESFSGWDGTKYRMTYVRSTAVEINEAGLFKALGKKAKKVSDMKVNRRKLEQAMEAQEIDPTLVAPYLKEVHRNPYLRLSEVKSASSA